MGDEFDNCQWIAGFPLTSIQKAIFWVGFMDDRDDVKDVCDALGCGPRRATGVLEELEELGFVTRGKKRNQWCKTDKGQRLAFHWKPPRRFRPLIHRDDEDNAGNQGIEDVFCLLFGSREDEEVFEEARLHVLFWPQYEGSHLVEVSVFEPDDYDDPGAGGSSTTSAYLAPAEARAVAAGLLKAADMADAEIARRAKHAPKHKAIPKEETPSARVVAPGDREQVLPSAGSAPQRRADRKTEKRNRDALAATLAELGHGRQSRKA